MLVCHCNLSNGRLVLGHAGLPSWPQNCELKMIWASSQWPQTEDKTYVVRQSTPLAGDLPSKEDKINLIISSNQMTEKWGKWMSSKGRLTLYFLLLCRNIPKRLCWVKHFKTLNAAQVTKEKISNSSSLLLEWSVQFRSFSLGMLKQISRCTLRSWELF